MKSTRRFIACFVLVWAIPSLLAGCATPIQAVNNPLEVAPSEYDRLFEAIVHELRDRGFVVDRRDYRFGTVSTRPVGSPTILEPWRADNTTDNQAFASTVNYQRRQITVTLEPVEPAPGTDQPHRYLLRAEVIVERVVVPTTYATGSTTGRRVIGKLTRVPTEWQQRGITGHYWRPIGRDPYLEQQLIDAIVRRSLAPVPRPEQADQETAEAK